LDILYQLSTPYRRYMRGQDLHSWYP
jgi:hypothetical protein